MPVALDAWELAACVASAFWAGVSAGAFVLHREWRRYHARQVAALARELAGVLVRAASEGRKGGGR